MQNSHREIAQTPRAQDPSLSKGGRIPEVWVPAMK
jgi:hypothetical protein